MSGKKTIVTLLRVSLLACPLLFTTPSFAMIDTPSVKVGFSPEGSASALVLDTINSAESSIRMMAYSFTDPDVMHALAKAKNAELTSVLLLMTREYEPGKSGSDEIYQPAGHSSADCRCLPHPSRQSHHC